MTATGDEDEEPPRAEQSHASSRGDLAECHKHQYHRRGKASKAVRGKQRESSSSPHSTDSPSHAAGATQHELPLQRRASKRLAECQGKRKASAQVAQELTPSATRDQQQTETQSPDASHRVDVDVNVQSSEVVLLRRIQSIHWHESREMPRAQAPAVQGHRKNTEGNFQSSSPRSSLPCHSVAVSEASPHTPLVVQPQDGEAV